MNLRRQRASTSDNGANGFADFFEKKVGDVRSNNATATPPMFRDELCEIMDQFKPVTVNDMAKLLSGATNKTCKLDPVPRRLVKSNVDVLSHVVTMIFNRSLELGKFPEVMKTAIVTPLLKKVGLDSGNMANYRPVSNV
jgi:hypothetical protein